VSVLLEMLNGRENESIILLEMLNGRENESII